MVSGILKKSKAYVIAPSWVSPPRILIKVNIIEILRFRIEEKMCLGNKIWMEIEI